MKQSIPPEWFLHATGYSYSDHFVDVEDCTIHYQKWSGEKPQLPGLIFVHGHGANAHWWDFIAPAFLQHYQVVALDVSGAGDSGHRSAYTTKTFVAEILAVIEDAGFDNRCVLAGHSFGGRMVRFAAHSHPNTFAGVILIDSAIILPGRNNGFNIPQLPERPTRFYTSKEQAARRFRLRPPQPCENKFIVDYIAQHSVKEQQQGWCWKLDQRVFSKMADLGSEEMSPGEMIKNIQCPVAIIYGKQSRFYGETIVTYVDSLLAGGNIWVIENAHHHVFLDQPEKFITALSNQLTTWRRGESLA